MVADSKYSDIIEQIITWSEQDPNIESAIIIGSQVQNEKLADEWSDLDLMLLANDPQALLSKNHWLEQFGNPVCAFNYVTVLNFVEWNWVVKRVLFDDNRDVDFSILPFDQLDSVLSVNKEIISKGYHVIHDSDENLVDHKIQTLIKNMKEKVIPFPTQTELCNDIDDILFHIIWVYKKIKRKELWVAVSTINNHIRDLLLKMIEIHNQSVTKRSSSVMYDGRFLEGRTDREIIEKLRHCFSKYDENDAVNTLSHIFDFVYSMSKQIFTENGYDFSVLQFDSILKIFTEM
jgi:aminoglycoside 6-adenylyltransferase